MFRYRGGTRLSDPACLILAGPNGSGKSSFQRGLVLPGIFVNADDTAKTLDPDRPESKGVAAGRIVLQQLRDLTGSRSDFTYETTLSSRQATKLIRETLAAGYHVTLVFLTLESVELNVARVAARVAKGGHDIPEDVIRRRWDTSIQGLAEVIALVNVAMVYDNSDAAGPTLLLQVIGGVVTQSRLTPSHPSHARLATTLATGLGLAPDALLAPARHP